MASRSNNSTAAHATVALYKSVISDVVDNVREAFLDDGADEHVLQELKSLWENKVRASGTVDFDGLGAGAQPRYSAQGIIGGKKIQLIPGGKAVQHTGVIQPPQGADLSRGARDADFALSQMHGMRQQQSHIVRVPQPGGSVIMLQGNSLTLPSAYASGGGTQFVLPVQGPRIPTQMNQQRRFIGKIESQQHHGSGGPPQTDGPGRFSSFDNGAVAGPSANNLPSQSSDTRKSAGGGGVPQLDGAGGLSDDEDSNLGDDDLLDVEDEVPEPVLEEPQQEEVDEGEPLNSDDDIENSDDETETMFEADSVVICQYDKVQRNKNKWKFSLKDGVMNLNGKDLVFSKANGEAEW